MEARPRAGTRAARLLPWQAAAALVAACAALPEREACSMLQTQVGGLQSQGQLAKDPPAIAAEDRGTCSAFQHLGLYNQAEADFSRYAGGLSAQQQAAYGDRCKQLGHCLSVIIADNRLFVQHLLPEWQSRHRSTLHAVYRVSQRFGPLPDAHLVIDVGDGPDADIDLPLFVMARRKGSKGSILCPDFTFFTWPESVCPSEASHAYRYLHALYAKRAQREEADAEAAWAAKRDALFWRGGGSGPRGGIVAALQAVPGTDAAIVEWTKNTVIGKNKNPGCVGLLDTCDYKYLPYLDGSSYSSSLKYKLLCGSCVFAGPLAYEEWWTGLLKPGEDLVQVRADWSDAAERLAEVRALPDRGRGMARRSRQKFLELLSDDAVDCYWLRLIELASQHLPRPDLGNLTLRGSMRPIEDVLLYGDSVKMDGEAVTE